MPVWQRVWQSGEPHRSRSRLASRGARAL